MALYSKYSLNLRPRLKAYKKIGIRRSENLGDLSNSAKGLESLLDSLVDLPGESFILEDLNSIKNIFASGLEVDNYRNIIGSSVKITVPSGETVTNDPRITYQNRIDKFEIFSGIPRFAGGDGLSANYFQNDQVNFNSLTSFPYNNFSTGNPLDPNLPESKIFLDGTSEGEIPGDKFWEDGEFRYTGKVHPQSVKANTGVKWEGYYIPRETGKTDFLVASTGFYTFDFSREDYFEDNNNQQTSASEDAQIAAGVGVGKTYTNYARVGLTTTITATGSATIPVGLPNAGQPNNNIIIAANRTPTVGIGMSVTGTNINSTGGSPIVESIDHTTGVISLTPVEGQTNAVTGALNNDVTFIRHFGDECVTKITTPVLTAFEKYRIRIRYFHPQVLIDDTVLEDQIRNLVKRITIHHRPPFSTVTNDLDYRYLYSLGYDFTDSAKGVFNQYFDKSVLFGGTILGEGVGNRNNSNEYVRLKTSNKIDLKYQAKKSLAKITKVNSRSGALTNGSKIIPINPTGSIEIGNYVFGNNIPEGTRVDQITTNNFIVVSKAATGTGNENLKFIDHRGFVKKITCNGSGDTISNANPALRSSNQNYSTIDTDVQIGMVVIGANTVQNSFTTIDDIIGTTALKLSQNLASNFTGGDIFIYQSRGLKDNSIQNFCDRFNTGSRQGGTYVGPRIRCLISNHETTDGSGAVTTYTTAAGITTVRVDDLNGVAAGWELQGAYFTESTDTVASAGIIVDSVDSSKKIITLKNGMTRPLPDGAQFTAVSNETPSKQNEDYQLCCPPTDTSPPFDASEEGLNTTSTYPNFKLVGGNLKFDSLIIEDTNSNAEDIPVGNAVNVDRKIEIRTPLSTETKRFKLLGTIT